MGTDTIYVVGAGGHAKVVVDALLASGIGCDRLTMTDYDSARLGQMFLGIPIQVPAVSDSMSGSWFHVAVGNNRARKRIYAELVAIGARPLTVVHPSAVVSRFAYIGEGSFVAANSVIAPLARVSSGSIVNHGAVIDHDCKVGEFSHIAPNATLGGAVHVGTCVLVGAGANVLPGLSIEEDAVVGAGAVVITDVMAGHTCIGVPALSRIEE